MPPTVIHMVFFRFRAEITQEHKATFVQELKKLKSLSCVKDSRLIVGGPSITDPIARSQGYEIAIISYHHDKKALEAYQASKEHHHVTHTWMFPYIDDLVRFDFEVAPEDEYMCDTIVKGISKANGVVVTPDDTDESGTETNSS